MEMNVRDDQKLVEIWLTNAEKIDPVLREGLKEIYAKYKTKKYMVAVFESGKGDFMRTRGICCSSTAAAAPKRPCSRRKSSGPWAWSGKPRAEGSNPFRPFSFCQKGVLIHNVTAQSVA